MIYPRMSYSESIRGGFKLINSRWQLVLVQVAMMLLNCLGFFIMVGIPLGIAFVIFGLDLTGLAEIRDVMSVFRNPADLLSKYFGLLLIVLSSFLMYIVVVTTVGLFVFSGSIGVIGGSILESSLRFSMKGFFAEAKKRFFPLMWYSLFVGLVFLLIAFVLGIVGGGVAALVSAAKAQDSTLALFLGIFFSLVLALISVIILAATLAVTVYGIAVVYFKGKGSVRSFREAARFLWEHQNAFWLYVILLVGYVAVSFVVMLVVYPLHLIPIIGTILSFPLQIISYVVQGYLGLVILAVVFNYYYRNEIAVAEAKAPVANTVETASEGPGESISESSTPAEDTSFPQAEGQGRSHPPMDEKAQD